MVNSTRVRAARIHGRRIETGGVVELLLLEREDASTWEALARPSRRLRPGVTIAFGSVVGTIVSEPADGRVKVVFDAPDLDEVLPDLGEIPLPPYFTGHLPRADRYQTMFADLPGSAAAPTAGLHFTPEVMDGLAVRGVAIAEVDLHVSLDTFRPMSTSEVDDHEMHTEWCSIPETTARAVERTRDQDRRVVAVGTTVVRTLESRATVGGRVEPGAHRTDLFLKPGTTVGVVDALITNFHLPGSTLLVLLATFMGDRWRLAYETALERRYRFLSFGDAMFAVRAE